MHGHVGLTGSVWEGLDRGGAEEQLCQTLQASPFDDGGFGDGGRGGTFE